MVNSGLSWRLTRNRVAAGIYTSAMYLDGMRLLFKFEGGKFVTYKDGEFWKARPPMHQNSLFKMVGDYHGP